MERFSPKIEIINHFDDLIQRVDVDIEESHKKYKENQVLGELQCFQVQNRHINDFRLNFAECKQSKKNKEQTVDQWSESTKVADYLNQVRMTTIEELRKEQKESVENSSCFNSLINSELTKEEKRSELFAEKFYFQVEVKNPTKIPYLKSWVFNIFTFVTDFYMSQSDIDLLEKFINTKVTKDLFSNQNHIFDEKMVLIVQLYKYLCNNIKKQKFPNHVISFFKKDASKISKIEFYFNIKAVELNSSLIYLSILSMKDKNAKLDYIIIDNLSSLESLSLEFYSVKEISFKSLYALKELYLHSNESINMKTDIFDHLPNIEKFSFFKKSMWFKFYKLEKTTIRVHNRFVWDDLILDLFMKKFHNEIENLNINLSNNEIITKLLSENDFSKLITLNVSSCDISRIEKKWFDRSPLMFQTLDITCNYKLQMIDYDAFFDLKQLVSLELSNNDIEVLDTRLFLGLINLECLTLSYNRIKSLDEKIFSDLKNLKRLYLSHNELQQLDANSFVDLDKLNHLSFSFNYIEKIDHEAFSNLKQLVSLDLSRNSIESLDRRHFSSLIKLESLNICFNRLKSLDENIFSDLKNLKELFLSSNKLEQLDANSFVGLENLIDLNLSNNKIEKIDHEAFSNLKQLVSLDLRYNSIQSLDRELFSNLINLERLCLSRNRLKSFNVNILSDLKNLKMLYISGNQTLESQTLDAISRIESLKELDLIMD